MTPSRAAGAAPRWWTAVLIAARRRIRNAFGATDPATRRHVIGVPTTVVTGMRPPSA